MTSTRRRKAPLAPGAGISTRSSRGSRWSSRCLQPTVLLRLVIMFKLVLVEAPAPAPAVLQSVLFGQKLEDNYWGTRRVVDVASPTVLEGHDCSAAAPCWALVRGPLALPRVKRGRRGRARVARKRKRETIASRESKTRSEEIILHSSRVYQHKSV